MLITNRKYFTMEDVGITAAGLKTILGTGTYVSQLADALYLKFETSWIIYADKIINSWDSDDTDPSEPDDKLTVWKDHMALKYTLTADRYTKLLDLYDTYESQLMSKITSSTTTKFNDTPQASASGFDADTYTTTITNVSTEVDPTNVMNRIDEIHNKYKNLLADWVDEFTDMFGESTLL